MCISKKSSRGGVRSRPQQASHVTVSLLPRLRPSPCSSRRCPPKPAPAGRSIALVCDDRACTCTARSRAGRLLAMSSSISLLLAVVPAYIPWVGLPCPEKPWTTGNHPRSCGLPDPWDDKAHLYNSFVITASGNTVVVIDAYSLFAFLPGREHPLKYRSGRGHDAALRPLLLTEYHHVGE